MRCGGLPLSVLLFAGCAGGCSSCTGGKEQPAPIPPAVIARLTSVTGSVKVKRATDRDWSAGRIGLELRAEDMVRTGQGSSARVAFAGGGQLDLEDLSLVVIQAGTATAPHAGAADRVARVVQGSIRGVSRPGAPPVKVVTADGQSARLRADGKEPVPFRVRLRPGGKLEVAVTEASEAPEAPAPPPPDRPSAELASSEVVAVAARRVSTPVQPPGFPELTAPGIDARFELGSPVMLRWSRVERAVRYRVQISISAGFDTRLKDVVVSAPERRFSPPHAGSYVWRVAAIDGRGREGEFGYARRFHVAR